MSEAATPDLQFQALVRERYAGNPQAMAALGAQLVVGRDAPYAPVDGAALLAGEKWLLSQWIRCKPQRVA